MNENCKISIIMQSYLGNYNNGRKNSEYKFIRAVNSFLDQEYKNQELIIVSDGCETTWKLYKENFKQKENIKFIYVEKKINKFTYDLNDNNKKFYRGTPRNFGIEAANGDIISYLDADDMMHFNFSSTLSSLNEKYPDKDWFLNRSWIAMVQDNWIGDTSYALELPNLPGKWMATWMPEKDEMFSTMMVSHRSNLNIRWEDTIGRSEDTIFIENLIKKYPNFQKYNYPIYIYCHHYGGRYDV